MKKFIFGFILGAFFFGSIAMAASLEDTIKIKWDISSIIVDGKKVNLKKENPSFTYNGIAYFPSYILNELDYVASRGTDGKTVVLKTKGHNYFFTSDTTTVPKEIKYIPVRNAIANRSTISFNLNSKDVIKVKNKEYNNYVHMKFHSKTANAPANAALVFDLNSEYRRLSMVASLTSVSTVINTEPVTMKIYLTNEKKEKKLYSTYIFESSQTVTEIDIPLASVAELEIVVTNVSEKDQGFVLLNASVVR